MIPAPILAEVDGELIVGGHIIPVCVRLRGSASTNHPTIALPYSRETVIESDDLRRVCEDFLRAVGEADLLEREVRNG